MTDQTTDDQTVDTTIDGNWYDSLAGEDEGRTELLSQYESPDAFFEAHNSAVNRDWRQEIAGDDDKFKSKLDRFADPGAFGTAYREAEQKIRAGDIGPKAPGEDATEDEVKEYRRQIGVPLEASEYLKNLPEGLVIGEADKELVGSFAERMHGKNVSPEVVHEGIAWYNELEEQAQADQEDMDRAQKQEAIEELRNTETGWGNEYRTNMALVNGLLDSTFGEEGKQALLNGRYMDGKGFFNDPNILRGLAELARKVNPVGPLIPNDTNAVDSMHEEIKGIEAKMGTAEYRNDEAMQARYRELVAAREKLNEKNAA